MLRVNQLVGFGGAVTSGPPPLTATYRATVSSTTNATSYSFASTAIGAASSTRYIVLLSQVTSSTAVNNGTALVRTYTVAGQACTVIQTTSYSYVSGSNSVIAHVDIVLTNAPVTSGTTATVALSLDRAGEHSYMGVYSVTGAATVTELDGETNNIGAPAASGSITLQQQPGRAIFALAYNIQTPAMTWTNLSNAQILSTSPRVESNHKNCTTETSVLTVTVDPAIRLLGVALEGS